MNMNQNRQNKQYTPSRWSPADQTPALVFHPLAWLKLQMLLHAGQTEIAGFGISSESDLLYVERFETVLQKASAAYVEMDDSAVADLRAAALCDGHCILRPSA
jgi:hypothetical protein